MSEVVIFLLPLQVYARRRNSVKRCKDTSFCSNCGKMLGKIARFEAVFKEK